jgi:mRNA interferase RelE/StbE
MLRVEWQPRAIKEFARLDARVQMRVSAAIERLTSTDQGDVVRLTDVRPPEFRLRVGDVRVIFEVDTGARTLTVLHVLPRGTAYR